LGKEWREGGFKKDPEKANFRRTIDLSPHRTFILIGWGKDFGGPLRGLGEEKWGVVPQQKKPCPAMVRGVDEQGFHAVKGQNGKNCLMKPTVSAQKDGGTQWARARGRGD